MPGSFERPGRWTQLTGVLNRAVWALPLPRRSQVLLSALVYRNPQMPLERALQTLAALEAVRLRPVVIGGWGVDALAGHQQRRHRDLDLIMGEGQLERAVSTLEGLGYKRWNRTATPTASGDIKFRSVQTMRDPSLRVVELHEIDLVEGGPDLAHGTLAGRPVACISAGQQLRSQSGRTWTLRRLQSKRVMAATVAALLAAGTAAPDLTADGEKEHRGAKAGKRTDATN